MPTDKNEVSPIDVYIAEYPKERQAVMKRMREAIRAGEPQAREAIKWSMPTFVYHGNMVHFSAHKHHLGFHIGADAIDAFKEELAPYQTTKSTVRFLWNEPVDYALVEKITAYNARQKLEAARGKAKVL
ncbi:MAG: iron chaperone [Christensenellales bacterium]|jgi:uncharacterized protein YdhG (YjbR/CyaY superfamily)